MFTKRLLLGLIVLLSGCAINPPYEKNPVLFHTHDKTSSLEITFLGNSTLYFKSNTSDQGNHAVLIDGFVSRPSVISMMTGLDYEHPSIQPILNAADIQLGHNDYLIPLHSHYDHLLDAPYIAYDSGATLLASPTTEYIADGIEKALRQKARQDGEVESAIKLEKFTLDKVMSGQAIYQVGAFEVVLEKAIHNDAGPIARSFAPLCDNCALSGCYSEKRPSKAFKEGISVNVHLYDKRTGKRLYVMGGLPADYKPGSTQSASKLWKADIVFLTVPVMKYSLKNQQEWDQFFNTLAASPKKIIPVHWDVFTRGLDYSRCQSPDLSKCLLVMPMFKSTIKQLTKTVDAAGTLTMERLTGFSTLSVLPTIKTLPE